MRIDLKQDVVSLTDFARNTKRHAKELVEGGRPRVLTQNGKAAVVILSVDAFENISRDAEEHRMDLRLRAALECHAAGEFGEPAPTVFAKIRKHRSARS